LSELLSYNRQLSRGSFYTSKQEEDSFSLVILRGGNNLLAVQVDQVIGELEIVIKQIAGPIPKTAGIAGATVLGDGTVMPIGDVLELIDIARGRLRTDNGGLWRQPVPPVAVETSQKSEAMVLIVDDSITVLELLSLSFSKAGYRVEQARDGQEAWEKLRGGLPCDIVFCDIEMPRMNGLELLYNLRKDPRLASIPVALLTSRGAERHRQVAATLGASGYFTKPYTERDLLSAAERMIAGEVLLANSIKANSNRSLSTDTTIIDSNPANFFAQSTPRVLIVDDSVTAREMLAISLVKAGYRIEKARDGLEAWEKLRAGLACDLILCDLEMPRLNGLELLSRLQEDEQLQGIPVAMITSRGSQKMQHLAAAKGAKGYFVKPYIEEVLLSAAQRLIAGEVLIQKENPVD
jgi:chemosensory pili system protein ChpA (sensor histidine kinase/response regulator)